MRKSLAFLVAGFVVLLGFTSPAARAAEYQFFRIRADAPTVITGLLPNGQLTWTSSVPDIKFTVEALPGGQSS